MSSHLCNTEDSSSNDIDTDSCLHTINKRSHHEDEKDIHTSHHLAHIRNILTWNIRGCWLSYGSELSLQIGENRSDDSKNDIFGRQKIHTEEMSIDDSASKRIRLNETSTETGKKTIEPPLWYRSSCHIFDHPIESDKDRYLDKHHETSFERAFSIGFEDFHGLFRQFFGIIFIFFLDFIEFRLKCSHTFLHIISRKRLFDHQSPDSDSKENYGNTEITTKDSEKYSQDIENRTIQDLSKQHSQHNKNFI